jgi:hypothetical protein
MPPCLYPKQYVTCEILCGPPHKISSVQSDLSGSSKLKHTPVPRSALAGDKVKDRRQIEVTSDRVKGTLRLSIHNLPPSSRATAPCANTLRKGRTPQPLVFFQPFANRNRSVRACLPSGRAVDQERNTSALCLKPRMTSSKENLTLTRCGLEPQNYWMKGLTVGRRRRWRAWRIFFIQRRHGISGCNFAEDGCRARLE